MSAPKIAGFPCWVGLKKKTARKFFKANRSLSGTSQTLKELGSIIKVGELFNDCDTFNHKLAKIEPEYRNVGGGKVLVGFWCTKENGNAFCHVSPVRTYAKEHGDEWGFVEKFQKGTLNQDGTFNV